MSVDWAWPGPILVAMDMLGVVSDAGVVAISGVPTQLGGLELVGVLPGEISMSSKRNVKVMSRGETLLKILGAKWAPKFLNLGAHFNFQGPTSFEYRFAKKKKLR